MKSEEQVKIELNGLIEYCKKAPPHSSNRAWIEGRIFTLLWILGSPSHEAVEKSHELANPIKAVCPPPQV